LSGKYNDQFPSDTRLGIEGLEWLKDKNITLEKIEITKKLTSLANEIGLSLPIMSLAWCLKNPNVSTVILGASKEAQLTENLEALDAQDKLTSDVLERIETILENKPVHPAF
jgi:aryl-alcohol dehydrogenase-like predicted oxidoreductase